MQRRPGPPATRTRRVWAEPAPRWALPGGRRHAAGLCAAPQPLRPQRGSPSGAALGAAAAAAAAVVAAAGRGREPGGSSSSVRGGGAAAAAAAGAAVATDARRWQLRPTPVHMDSRRGLG